MNPTAAVASRCWRMRTMMHAGARRASRILINPAFVLILLAACTSQAERKAQHMSRGEEYFTAGKYKEAEIEFRNALQIDPKLAAGHAQLGKTYLALKDPRNAFAEFQRALEL